MRAVRRNNLTGHFSWIGSDGWAGRSLVSEGNEPEVEGTLSVLPQSFEVRGFNDYFLSLTPINNKRNPWFIGKISFFLFVCRPPGNLTRCPQDWRYWNATLDGSVGAVRLLIKFRAPALRASVACPSFSFRCWTISLFHPTMLMNAFLVPIITLAKAKQHPQQSSPCWYCTSSFSPEIVSKQN